MDPRTSNLNQRMANHSPLMKALLRKQTGEIIAFCPFGCRVEQGDYDENGYCGHLIGFYQGGKFFEPRVKRKKDQRIIVDGRNKLPMQKGYKLLRITTCARVYSPKPVKDLIPNVAPNTEMYEIEEEEARLLDLANRMKNPVLEGDWDDSIYNEPVAAAAGSDPPK